MEESLNYEIHIKKSKWKHYKGKLYETIDVAFNDNAEPMVLYKPIESDILLVSFIKDFFNDVEDEDYKGPKFIEIK
ncbi:MAG: DUF1653 domain-containing protein [bacterium]